MYLKKMNYDLNNNLKLPSKTITNICKVYVILALRIFYLIYKILMSQC